MCLLWKRSKAGRLIPVVRGVTEQPGPVAKTPQHKRWPVFGELLMGLQLTSSQKVDLSITPVDKKGNPALVEDIKWLTDNSEVVALSPSGNSCSISAVGPLGVASVTVTCDALIGEGVETLTGRLDIEVVAGKATVIEITAGTPVEQDAVPVAPPG